MPTLTPVHRSFQQSQCLVRMVNGAVDPSQNGKYAAPVMTLAKKIGIPVVLVDIRMEASHQELPPLGTLRHGSECALQWLFERYWNAQRQVLDAVRDGACEAVAELVTAECARREKAERVAASIVANRGKGKRRKGGGKPRTKDDDSDDGSDDDDDSDDDEAFVNANDARDMAREDEGANGGGEDEGADANANANASGSKRRKEDTPGQRRRDALNRLANVVHKDDTKTVVKALLIMGAAVARAEQRPPEPDEEERTRMEDWKETAARLKKRWDHVHEELVLQAVEDALLSDPEVAGSTPTPVEIVAKAAVEVFAAHTLDMGPEKRSDFAEKVFGAGSVGDGGVIGDAGPKTRQKALTWHLLRRTMSLPDPTKGQTELGEALLQAVGGGRKFNARAGALLSGEKLPPSDKTGKKEKGKKSKDEEPRQQQQQQRKEPIRAGKWTLVEDWTPCAFGDIPAHLRGVDPGSSDYRPMTFGSGPAEKAPPPPENKDDEGVEFTDEFVDPPKDSDPDPLAGLADTTAPDDPPMGSVKAIAELLWGSWPRRPVVGFGEAVAGVNYSVGAPFVDPSRRMVTTHKDQSDTPYVEDGGVLSHEEISTGHRPLKNPPKDGSHLKPGFVRKPGRSVGVGRGGSDALTRAVEDGMKFGFVDPDDDEVTETLEGYEGPGGAGAEEVDMQTAAEDEEMEEEEEEEEAGGDVDGTHGGDDDDDGDRGGDGMAVSIGGVRVVLSAEDRDAVASNVECLM